MQALSKEKHSLTRELQKKIKEIRKERSLLRKQVQLPPESFASPDEATPPPSEKTQPEPQSLNVLSRSSRNFPVTVMRSQELMGRSTRLESVGRAEADPRMALLQRDREIYDAQNRVMLHQVMILTIRLEESRQRAAKCNKSPPRTYE